MKPLAAYKKILKLMPDEWVVRHICEMTYKYGIKATALFSLIFDDFNVFKKLDDPDPVRNFISNGADVVAFKFIQEIKRKLE